MEPWVGQTNQTKKEKKVEYEQEEIDSWSRKVGGEMKKQKSWQGRVARW